MVPFALRTMLIAEAQYTHIFLDERILALFSVNLDAICAFCRNIFKNYCYRHCACIDFCGPAECEATFQRPSGPMWLLCAVVKCGRGEHSIIHQIGRSLLIWLWIVDLGQYKKHAIWKCILKCGSWMLCVMWWPFFLDSHQTIIFSTSHLVSRWSCMWWLVNAFSTHKYLVWHLLINMN